MRLTARFAVIFLLLILSPLAASLAYAQPVQTPIAEVGHSTEIRREDNGFRHIAASFLFPTSLGDMPARKLITYGPSDMSINYTLYGGANGDGWIDLYVYPARGSLDEEAEALTQDIVARYATEAVSQPLDFPVPDKNIASSWYRINLNGTPYLSGFQLAHYGDWAVKVRISLPQDAAPDVMERAAAALAEHPTRWR